MNDVYEKAKKAEALLEHPDLLMLFEEVRKVATVTFLNPNSSVEQREAAHDKVRAVNVITTALERWISDAAVEAKKVRHRAND